MASQCGGGLSGRLSSCRVGGLALLALFATLCAASGQTVLARGRTGNNFEAMTFVGNGPLEDSIVFVDGYQLRSVSAEPCHRHCAVNDLIDLRVLPLVAEINGLAYVSADKTFLLWDGNDPSTWFVLDRNGQPLPGTLTVTHLPGLGNWVEGMVYLPSSARRYGDRILGLSWDGDGVTHIEVIKRNGQAVADIVPQGALLGQAIAGIGYKAPDHLLLGTYDSFLWEIDLDGNVVRGPIDASPNSDFEGVVQTSEGKIVAGSYLEGTLMFFDKRFNRLPKLDRDIRVGVGKPQPFGVAWDSETQSLLVNPFGQGFVQQLGEMPVSLDSYVEVSGLEGFTNVASDVAYLAAEHRIGVTQVNNPRAVFLYDESGAQTEEVDIQDPSARGVLQTTFVPTRQQFASRLNGDSLVHLAGRNGDFVGDLDLSAFGVTDLWGLTFFPAGPGDPNPAGNLAVTDSTSKHIVFMDVDATTVLGEFDFRSPSTLNMMRMSLGYITNGPLAGAFIGLDDVDSEIVIFRR